MADEHNPRAFPSVAIADKCGAMLLRDYFAGQALTGFASRGMIGAEQRAKEAYDFADAMMAERAKVQS